MGLFKKLYNKVIIPVITFLLPGITLRKLFIAVGTALLFSIFFYLMVFPRVNNKEWVVFLVGFGAVFLGVLFTRTIANLINNILCNRKEVLIAASKTTKSNK